MPALYHSIGVDSRIIGDRPFCVEQEPRRRRSDLEIACPTVCVYWVELSTRARIGNHLLSRKDARL